MRNVVCVSGADVTRGSGRRDGLEGETEVTFAGSFDAQQREAGVLYPTMKRAVLESRETGDGGDIVETVSYPENVHSAKGRKIGAGAKNHFRSTFKCVHTMPA